MTCACLLGHKRVLLLPVQPPVAAVTWTRVATLTGDKRGHALAAKQQPRHMVGAVAIQPLLLDIIDLQSWWGKGEDTPTVYRSSCMHARQGQGAATWCQLCGMHHLHAVTWQRCACM